MAQLLKDRHSSNVHKNIVRRFMRLCRQVKNAEEFGVMLEPLFSEFKQKRLAYKTASEICEDLYDTKVLKDAFLDDKIRDLNEDCIKYDRNNPGSQLTTLLFPNGLTAIVRTSIDDEPEIVQNIIVKLGELGAEHELASHIPILQAVIDDSKAAIAAHAEAKTNLKTAQTLVNISKGNLNQQYEKVTYAAKTKFGKAYADRLFPPIRIVNKKGNKDSNEGNEE